MQGDILRFWVRLATLQVVEIAACRLRLGIVAGGEPRLREMRLTDVVGRARAAHLGRDPSGRHGVRQHIRPEAGDGESEQDIVQLALGIGRRSIPLPLAPQNIVEIGVRPLDACPS